LANVDNVDNKATDDVAERIARRYAHPERVAYTYLFRLAPGNDFGPLVPLADHVLSSWMDEGDGLAKVEADSAARNCQAAYEAMQEARRQSKRPKTSHERRQQMARSILFTVTRPAEDEIDVHLLSRALAFSPKGDREVVEKWRRSAEGWFSSYQPRADELGPA
jgi:hypothetical protein